ncbi:GGDEF domain-containing protein [Photobacterium marinum]|nr:GGDEF domain-containing protein [Photobacterium marinum]
MAKLSQHFRLALYFLIFVTVSSYICYLNGLFDTELVISSKLASFKNIDDSNYGGSSMSWLNNDGRSLSLGCRLTDSSKWPFCGVSMVLTNGIKGIDLSKYHSIGLELDYKSPVNAERVRVYLRNFDPSYSDINDPLSLKYNMIEFEPESKEGLLIVPMRAFQVLSWWIADYEIPIEYAGPQFDNVTEIQISTSGNVAPADYELKIKSLVFYGERISEAALLKFNIMLWLTAAGLLLVFEHFKLRRNLRVIEAKGNELSSTNKALHEKTLHFEQLAFIDALTGTKNRNAVTIWLDKAMEDVRANGQAFSLIYIDIDHFKSINDTFGHLKGDEILKEFATVLKTQIRGNDVFVRWGGEEFILFCPGVSLSCAEAFALHLRTVVESYQWGDDLPITCSIGVAELTGNESFESLLNRADSALYAAKHGGRNQVEVRKV